jgi:hypothetical protein
MYNMGIGKFFRGVVNKVQRGVTGVVNKIVKAAPGIVNTGGRVLSTISKVAGTVSDVGGKILSNPLVQGFIAANPELAPIYGGAIGLTKLIGQGGQVAGKGAQLAGKVSNILEKKRPVASIASNIVRGTFQRG